MLASSSAPFGFKSTSAYRWIITTWETNIQRSRPIACSQVASKSAFIWWVFAVILSFASDAHASPLGEPTASSWAWAQIKAGGSADFEKKCAKNTARPSTSIELCREIPAAALVNILENKLRLSGSRSGAVHLVGATIRGDIDLSFIKLDHALILENCTISGLIDLSHARSDSTISITGSQVLGTFNAEELHDDMSLNLDRSHFYKGVSLESARVVGDVTAEGASFASDLMADSIQVGGTLSLRSNDRHRTTVKGISLRAAVVAGSAQLDGMDFGGDLSADRLQVGGTLFMNASGDSEASFQGATLRSARVAGNVSMVSAIFHKDLQADGIWIGGYLLMQSQDNKIARFRGVRLLGARIVRDLQMGGSTFDGELDCNSVDVGANVIMRQTKMNAFTNFSFAKVGLSMDMRGAVLGGELRLSGATIGEDLILAGEKPYGSTSWPNGGGKPSIFRLRDTHVGALTDAKDAWPSSGALHLDGFTFSRFGGASGDAAREMRSRDAGWWDQWIKRDPNYSPMPYEQLARAFEAAGDRDRADDMRFLGRVRQRTTESGAAWFIDGVLQYVSGFGIGSYTFRVLYWVLCICLASSVYLYIQVSAARTHGAVWCFGASLSRLLPVIEISKEFSDFFDDPHRERITGFQSFIFALLSIVGWVLGAILIAAVAGLTQKP